MLRDPQFSLKPHSHTLDYERLLPLLNSPQSRRGKLQAAPRWPAAASVLVHLGLVAVFSISLSWKNKTPVAMDAELWSSVPSLAAPVEAPHAEPKPMPEQKLETKATPAEPEEKAADIGLKPPPKKVIDKPEPKPKSPEAKPEPKNTANDKARAAQEKAAEAARQRDLDRLKGFANGTQPNAGTAAQTAGVKGDAGWEVRLNACIKPNVRYTDDRNSNPRVELRVELLPTGEPSSAKVLKSSGIAAYDASVERAILRCNPFPRPSSGPYPNSVNIIYRLND